MQAKDFNSIFLVEKNSEFLNDTKKTDLFWEITRKYIDKINNINSKKESNHIIYDFTDVKFPIMRGNNDFPPNILEYPLRFVNTQFQGKVSFQKFSFNQITIFQDCKFFDEVVLSESSIKMNLTFYKCTFYKDVYFKGCGLQAPMFFELCTFEEQIFITESSQPHLDFDFNYLSFEYIDTPSVYRGTLRYMKHKFKEVDDHVQEDYFFSKEMKKIWKDTKFKEHPFEWILLGINGVISNFGQNWILPIIWWIGSSVLFYLYIFYTQDITKSVVPLEIIKGVIFVGNPLTAFSVKIENPFYTEFFIHKIFCVIFIYHLVVSLKRKTRIS